MMDVQNQQQDSPVRSDLTDSLIAKMEEDEKLAKAQKAVKNYLALQKGLREGTLTYAQFLKLPKPLQAVYARRYQRPLAPDEIGAEARRKAKRAKAAKAAKRSKVRNRRK